MLAHSGLALITEKLQNQRLEESPQSSCCSSLPKPSQKEAAQKANVAMTQDSSVKTTCQQQPSLAVKGKNVWVLSLESERQGQYEPGTQEVVKSSPRPAGKAQQASHTVMCRHKNLRHACQFCDSAPGTPAAPPKKKHCRSLSVPPDGLVIQPAPINDGSGKIWKPIAVIPQSNNNVQSSKDRNLQTSTHSSEPSSWLLKLSSGFKLVPVVPSPPSVDSGHYTTSDLQTPPGSPIPRPASATSDASFSSTGSVWHDYHPTRPRLRVLENRSLSCEDRISGSSNTSASCVHDSMYSSCHCRSNSSQDGSSICSSSSTGIPRCHSQPCVLHHRRCGKKRRRDCDRPTLNFTKMTETAYTRCHRRSESWNTSVSDQQPALPIFPDIRFGLNPIASSPLDSELPVVAQHLLNSDLNDAASTALPLTPPDRTSPAFPRSLSSRGHEDDEEDEAEEEDEEEGTEHRDCNCHDNQADERVGFFPMIDLDLEQIESH